jgi:aminopeptidase N
MRRFFLVLLFVSGLFPGGSDAQPAASAAANLDGRGVSIELARLRAAEIRDVRYALQLDLSSPDSAPGEVGISFVRSGSSDLLVDYRGRRITSVSVNGTPVSPAVFNGSHLRLAASSLRAGENVVRIGFVSEIAASGASIIRTRDAADGSDYLYTLLVPADANQLFPCFDQPDLKARVGLTLTAPLAWTVLGNGSVERVDTTGLLARTRFTETRPLSTYLIAFAAGPWTRFESASGGRTIHLYARRSRAKEVDADSLLSMSHRALAWMERYFGRAYPFEKFDMMLSPAFPFGGMEHPGLVMYNEDRFIFRDRPTLARRVGRFNTILHETAHQWFGDLVTMRWFDDLWLKEGFATYMGAKALAELEPGADAWKTFFQGNKPAAYGVDQTLGTTPLWQSLANLDQAKSAYGAIVYNKAPSVLKQLNHLVGDEAFQRGVRAFLERHAYANATWQDLLAAIGTSASRPLDEFGRAFMLRPGMPVLETSLSTAGGRITRLSLTQRPAQQGVSGDAVWPMKTRLLLAYSDAAPELLDVDLTGRTTEVRAAAGKRAPQFVFPNAGDFGYFLSILDSASVSALEVGALRAVTDPLLRTMLWGSLWDQVRDARMDPVRFARLVIRELPYESDEQILPSLTGRLDRALRAYVDERSAATLRVDAERVLWDLSADTRRPFGVRRAGLDAFIGIAASDQGRQRLMQVLGSDSVVGEPMRDPTRWAIVNRLLVLDDARASSALSAQSARDTTPDGRRRAFTAGAARKSAAAKADYFARYFSDRALNEDWASGSLGEFNAVEHADLTLRYLRPALDSLPFIQQNRRIFFLGSWLGAFLGGQHSEAAAAIVRDWLSAHPLLPLDLRQKVLQNADELERTARIRRVAAGRQSAGPRSR